MDACKEEPELAVGQAVRRKGGGKPVRPPQRCQVWAGGFLVGGSAEEPVPRPPLHPTPGLRRFLKALAGGCSGRTERFN